MIATIVYSITLRGSNGATRFLLDKKKMILGSHSTCDIQLIEETISSYHAFICVQGDKGIVVKDLCSEKGVFVNGVRVEETIAYAGDTISVGQCHFIIESTGEDIPVFDMDDTLEAVAVEDCQYVQYSPGLAMIDGEWCNITFDESGFKPLNTIPEMIMAGEHVELEETENAVELSHIVKNKCLEVISYINGFISEVKYVEIKNGDYYLSEKKGSNFHLPFYTISGKLFSIKKGKLKFTPNQSLTPSINWEEISLDETLFITHGTEQLSLRIIDKSFHWNSLPTFYRDKVFFKLSSKIFASVIIPFLLLLLVTLPKPEPEKTEVAIVYKLKDALQAPEKSELAATEVTSQTENTGHKTEETEVKKVEFAAAPKQEASSAAPAKKSAQITPKPSPEKVIADSAPVKTTQLIAEANGTPMPSADVAAAKPAPAKPYQFKSKSMSNLMDGGPSLAAVGTGSGKTLDGKSFGTGQTGKGDFIASASIGISKLNGSDSSGSGENSYGSRGVASKKGFDSASLEPNTVIRGSMDPELLRKILREYIPQFRHCYQKELTHHSEKINGIIELNFTINQNGKSIKHDIRMKDAKFSNEGVNCMVNVLNIIDFPKPKGGGIVDVKQPLNFQADSTK